MREIQITLADTKLTLQASFAASMEFAQTIADPMELVRESMLEQQLTNQGVPYTPRHQFTVETTAQAIWIGAKHHDPKTKLETIQQLVFESGFFEAKVAAMEYLSIIIGPRPDIDVRETKEGKAEGN